MHYKTDNRSLIVIFSIDDIAKILQNLDSNKTLIKSVFASYNYLVIQSANDWSSFGNNLLRVVLFRLRGKKGNVVTIHKKEDKGFEGKGVFLNISNVSDKVWHKDLIFRLKQKGIPGNLLNLLC